MDDASSLRLTRRSLLGAAAATPILAGAPAWAAPEGDCSFLVVGDWGKAGSPDQRKVARAMAQAAAEVGCRFVIAAGDNFYPAGVASTSDPQWLSSYETVYDAPSLQTPWYAALGNHDYRGAPQAQIDYTRRSRRWRMPDFYYMVSGQTLGAPAMDLFVLDTSPLVMGADETCAQLMHGKLWLPRRVAQMDWLERQLSTSQAKWKVVVGHHPVYSGGHHGSEPYLIEHLQPLLKRHGAQLYLNGHDHDLQHIERDGVHYACAGAGASAGRSLTPIAGTRFAAATIGFAVVTVSPRQASLQLRDADNRILHAASLAATA